MHKSSTDHDSRYYTEPEIDEKFNKLNSDLSRKVEFHESSAYQPSISVDIDSLGMYMALQTSDGDNIALFRDYDVISKDTKNALKYKETSTYKPVINFEKDSIGYFIEFCTTTGSRIAIFREVK